MQIFRALRIIFRVLVFVILLILAINNMQPSEFNFLGIYILRLPLIVTLGIFSFAGVFIGMIFGYSERIKLKNELKKVRKENLTVKKQEEAKPSIN
ncbi:MAG: DUF1049 domain-containing protein [Neisseriales bacterium]|jgi:uncharacterized integral membrane protein|nr:MAG: DUF1049 domain-containing protein [Neisseriales bacterium]